MTRWGKKSTVAAVVALVFLAVGMLWSLLSARSPVRILDQRFQVLDVRISRGTDHWIYDGNQFAGKMWYFLNGIGLPVKVPPRGGGHTQTNVWTLIVRCSGDFEAKELLHLRADLIDVQGSVTPLRWTSGGHMNGRRDYLDFWVLDSSPANRGRYRLRIRLPTDDTGLAEIYIGRL